MPWFRSCGWGCSRFCKVRILWCCCCVLMLIVVLLSDCSDWWLRVCYWCLSVGAWSRRGLVRYELVLVFMCVLTGFWLMLFVLVLCLHALLELIECWEVKKNWDASFGLWIPCVLLLGPFLPWAENDFCAPFSVLEAPLCNCFFAVCLYYILPYVLGLCGMGVLPPGGLTRVLGLVL